MKFTVAFFKPSGKFYTDEEIELSADAFAWDFRKLLLKELGDRFTGMTAVIMSGPWGYPALCVLTPDAKRLQDLDPEALRENGEDWSHLTGAQS